MKTKRRLTKRIAAIAVAVAVAFTSLPVMTGELAAHAAAFTKPTKVTGLTKTAVSTNSITVKWTKIKNNKNTKGYVIYVDGKKYKSVGNSISSCKITGLKANTSYKITVKAFNKRYRTLYWNKKTKKWVAKKPAKKYWGACPKAPYKGKKSRRALQYAYGTASSVSKVKTLAVDKDAVFTEASLKGDTEVLVGTGADYQTQSKGDIEWSLDKKGIATIASTAGNGASHKNRFCSLEFTGEGKVKLTAKSKLNGKSKTITITVSGKPSPDEEEQQQEAERQEITSTNYVGNTCTTYKDEDGKYWDSETGGTEVTNLAVKDRTVDGKWTDGAYTIVQKDGVTAKGVFFNQDGDGTVEIKVYKNGAVSQTVSDNSKVKLIVQETTKKYFNYNGNDFGRTYVLDSSGNRIAAYITDSTMPNKMFFKTSNNFGFDGIVSGTFHISAYYDFDGNGILADSEFICKKEINISKKTAADECYNIAQAAVNEYGTSSYMADMAAISAYMYEHCNYYDQVNGVSMYKCIGGANIQRIWSIRKWKVFGDVHQIEGGDGHEVFYPEGKNPYTVSAWFEANGHSSNSSNTPGASYYNSHLADLKATVEEYKAAGK